MTELAVLASSPVVGSSRNSTAGRMISSIPMLVLFRSPPDTPRINSLPTCKKWEGSLRRLSYLCGFEHVEGPMPIDRFAVKSIGFSDDARCMHATDVSENVVPIYLTFSLPYMTEISVVIRQ